MEPQQVWNELTEELEDTARWIAAGALSERELCSLLEIFGKRKLNGSCCKLTGSIGANGVVQFALRSAEDELLMVMEVDPQTGRMDSGSPCWGS